MKSLTKDQEKVLAFISRHIASDGAPPTLREIAHQFDYQSTNSVRQHLRLMEQKGAIRRKPGKARAIEILTSSNPASNHQTAEIPLVGTIAAGSPITAVENIEGTISVDRSIFKGSDLFSLRVKGDSMTGIGIFDGDIALIQRQNTVNNGEIAAVIIEDEATLKRFYREEKRIVLKAENPAYGDIIIESGRDVQIAGKLTGVLRSC